MTPLNLERGSVQQTRDVPMHARLTGLIVLAALAAPSIVAAQVTPHRFAGRHHITLSAGLNTEVRSGTTAGPAGASVTSEASGALGGLGYGYWLDERLSVAARLSAMGVSADISTSGTGSQVVSDVVATLQLGGRYQVATVTASNALRPHVGLSVGPLIGSTDGVVAGTTTTVSAGTQAVASGQVSLGAELSLGRRFTLGVDAGYFLAADFDEPIGGRTSYSSPVLSLTFGLVLGRGRPTGGS